MGQSISKKLKSSNDVAQIYLQLDRPFYYAGETINGTVYLNVLGNYPIKDLVLRLKGTETTHWQTQKTETQSTTQTTGNGTNTSTSSQTVTVDHKGKNVALNYKCPLFAFPNIISTGQYSFPFRLPIPDNVPGTFEIKGVSEGFSKIKLVKIRYFIAVSLSSLNPGVISSLEYKSTLYVRPKLSPEILSLKTFRQDSNVYQCCADKGHAVLTANFEKSVYALGEDVNIMAEADNAMSKCKILQLRAFLNQKIQLRANKLNADQIILNNIVASSEKSVMVDSGGRMQSPVNLTFRIQNPFLKDKSGVDMVQPTVSGAIVTCTYTLVVYIGFEGCCISGPEVKYDIYLYAPEFRPPPVPQPPSNWNPIVYSVGTVSIQGNQMSITGIAPPMGMPSVQINMQVPQMEMNMNTGANANIDMNLGGAKVEMNLGGLEMNMTTGTNANAQVTMNTTGTTQAAAYEFNI